MRKTLLSTFGLAMLSLAGVATAQAQTVEPGDTIYATDFSGDDALASWTVIDGNSDGTTWAALSGVGNATYNSDNASQGANDLIVSPAIKMEKGTDYFVSYSFAQQGSFDPDHVMVYSGSSNTYTGVSNYLSELTLEGNTGAQGKARYICTEDGEVYFGFLLTSENGENGQLSLTSFTVTAAKAATPKAVEGLEGELTEDKTVILRWTCPSQDTEGVDLAQLMGINIYENGTLVKTYEEVSPGTQGFEVLTPTTTTGKATFSVEAFIGDNKSEQQSVEINVSDVVGEPELVKAFAVSSATKGDWVIEDNKGNGAWAFDYGKVFSYNHKLGQKNQDDWLISPSVDLDASKRYILKYQLKTSMTYGTDIAVTIGNEQKSSAQTQVVASYSQLLQNGFGNYETEQFSIPETGAYYIGFHVTTANYSVSMQNLEVYVIKQSGTTGIEAVAKSGVLAYNRSMAQLALPAGATAAAIYNAGGTLVANMAANGSSVDLSSLASGIYVVSVKDAQGNNYRMKIAK